MKVLELVEKAKLTSFLLFLSDSVVSPLFFCLFCVLNILNKS